MLSLELALAWRYSRAREGRHIMSVVSWFAFFGIFIGICALIVVMSVMNGFDYELRSRLLNYTPHAYAELNQDRYHAPQLEQFLSQHPAVTSYAPYIRGELMLSVPGVVRAVRVTASDPYPDQRSRDALERQMLVGSQQQLTETAYGIIIGAQLASQMRVWEGDKITLILPKLRASAAGLIPRTKRFTVVGIFETGSEADGIEVLIRLKDGQKIFREPSMPKHWIQGYRILTPEILSSLRSLGQIEQSWLQQASKDDVVYFKHWSAEQQSLFRAIKMEKIMIAVLLFLVIVVAAFNVISLLSLLVDKKRGEIAVLRTLGLPRASILRVFVFQGVGIAVVACSLGAACGIYISQSIGMWVSRIEAFLGVHLFDPSVYFISELPSRLHMADVYWVVGASLMLSFIAGLMPAIRASQIPPASVLKGL